MIALRRPTIFGALVLGATLACNQDAPEAPNPEPAETVGHPAPETPGPSQVVTIDEHELETRLEASRSRFMVSEPVDVEVESVPMMHVLPALSPASLVPR